MMAKPRIYRDDMQCPRCGSNWLPKYGHARGKQTYRCGQCGYHFTPGAKHPHHAPETKRLAEAMYAEGLGISAIGRVLRVKLETAFSWVKKSLLGWGFVAEVGGVARAASAGPGTGSGHLFRRDVDLCGRPSAGPRAAGGLGLDGGD